MINEVCDRVRVELAARFFPYAVVYGPERLKRDGFQGGIIFERDRQAGDEITAPQGWRGAPGPRSPLQCRARGRVTIYARSPKPGAHAEHHEVECERVRDGVVCALYRVCQGAELRIDAARFQRADEWNGLETWPGSAYEIKFSVVSRIRELDYVGRGPDTADVAAVALDEITSGDLTLDLRPPDPPPEEP